MMKKYFSPVLFPTSIPWNMCLMTCNYNFNGPIFCRVSGYSEWRPWWDGYRCFRPHIYSTRRGTKEIFEGLCNDNILEHKPSYAHAQKFFRMLMFTFYKEYKIIILFRFICPKIIEIEKCLLVPIGDDRVMGIRGQWESPTFLLY